MVSTERKQHSSFAETLQSFVVAFVLAMVFRGFVVEGFVIPTGSMAPILLGEHLMKHSDQTGQDFAVGYSPRRSVSPERFSDPLLGRSIPLSMSQAKKVWPRSGDRVIVLKPLYSFMEPDRYDVVVFKNPTDTQGASANYIKRLIGLPGETLWIVDGEIFATSGDAPFSIQRKPEHIQKLLWRSVSDSDAVPTDTLALTRPWKGPSWIGRPQDAWTFEDRIWTCHSSEPSKLRWDHNVMPIDDWLPYNMLMPLIRNVPISDVRVNATITPETSGLAASFTLETLGHRFTWLIVDNTASLTMKTIQGVEVQRIDVPVEVLQAGMPTQLECWHADQMMSMYINGEKVATLKYEFGPEQRLRLATGASMSVPIEEIAGSSGEPPTLTWQFDGSRLQISRIQVDHDLYYLSATLPPNATKNPTKLGNEELVRIGSPAYGTRSSKLAVLGQDQFMMAGDNSAFSLDGRLWGNPDQYVASQIDDTPFVVNRELLIGKAWGVYWPAPHRFGSLPIIPDLGRIRFIR